MVVVVVVVVVVVAVVLVITLPKSFGCDKGTPLLPFCLDYVSKTIRDLQTVVSFVNCFLFISSLHDALPETNSSHLKMGLPKMKVIFQPGASC